MLLFRHALVVIGFWGLEDVRQGVRGARVCGFSQCFGGFERCGFDLVLRP